MRGQPPATPRPAQDQQLDMTFQPRDVDFIELFDRSREGIEESRRLVSRTIELVAQFDRLMGRRS